MGSEQSSLDLAVPALTDGVLPVRKVEEALGALHRAVTTCHFYPPRHPVLQEVLEEGYQAWREMEGDPRLESAGLRLKNRALWLGGSALGLANPALLSLAGTFAMHGVVGVVRKGVLSRDGFQHLVSLLATTPAGASRREGIVGAWSRSRFATLLELQRLAVSARDTSEPDGDSADGREDRGPHLSDSGGIAGLAHPSILGRFKPFLQQRGPEERGVLDLLLRLSRTEDIARYLDLLAEISRITGDYVAEERFREAFHVALFLYREVQSTDALGQKGKRDHLLETLRQLLRGPFLQWLIEFVTSARGREDAEIGEHILRVLGRPAVVPLINALVAARDRIARRRLVEVLVSIGESAVPYTVRMLDDKRWFVVRNMVTILGGVGTPEAVRAIRRVASDSDSRIRREVARALGRAHGVEAQEILLSLLADHDAPVRRVAASAAASHRTPEVLQALLGAFDSIRVPTRQWELKASFAKAIGRIGMAEAVEPLRNVLRKRPLFFRRRWEVVQVAITQALGDLGGMLAAEALREFQSHWSVEVRKAAVQALAGLGEGDT